MRTMSRASNSQSGLTLIEMLLALALLGFVLLAITPLFLASVKSNYSGNEYTTIHMLARDRLEQLMNLPFDHGQLSPGRHGNDLPPTLPDPQTGVPPTPGPGTVMNPFTVCYQVFQFQDPVGVPNGGSFSMNGGNAITPVTTAGLVFQYKRVDVTVSSSTGSLGIGTRRARVSGVLSNPAPETLLSVIDSGGSCP
jgi:prepilin-type N-terminal cleavage/methylation domain-containing protein